MRKSYLTTKITKDPKVSEVGAKDFSPLLRVSPSKIPGMGLSDVVTKGNRIVGEVHSLDAVRGLTTSYGFRHFNCP